MKMTYLLVNLAGTTERWSARFSKMGQIYYRGVPSM